MSLAPEPHLVYKIGNATINPFPYPHIYVENVFPDDYYTKLQAMLPDPDAMRPIEEVRPVRGYKERFILQMKDEDLAVLPEEKRAFWSEMHGWLVGSRFATLVRSKFAPYINQRFGSTPNIRFYDESMLVQDTTNYALGPHSDSPKKVVTFLFYLPRDTTQRHLGTSVYIPKDMSFRCPGGPHYPHDRFERVWTMPFVPNSLFAFVKTDNSFHGVEPVTDPDVRRWLLLYDIYHTVDAPQAPRSATPGVKFGV